MLNTPLVSVVIPTHNRPDFLKRTLNSILQQTYKNLEIIVVSNGVNTENKRIASEFKDSRLFYFDQENSGGPASPRNHAIRKATGSYVAFCDDDDLWTPDKIRRQIETLEENIDYGLCYSKMLRFNEKEEWHFPHEEGHSTLLSLLKINTIPISSVVIRKSLLDQFGSFLESKKVGSSEDYEFLLRYAAITKFYFCEDYLIKYWSGDSRHTESNPSFSRIITYYQQIFHCYNLLLKSKKIKLIQLLSPFFHLTASVLKILLNQSLVKLGLKK